MKIKVRERSRQSKSQIYLKYLTKIKEKLRNREYL
jgi:hypothetical protein